MPSFCHLQYEKRESDKSWVCRPGNEARGGGMCVYPSWDDPGIVTVSKDTLTGGKG